MNKGFRFLEAFVIALLIVIATCFAIQISAAAPPVAAMLRGFVPSTEIFTNPEMLYIAIGIIGATVMPHNLYLHSSIVQTRAFARNDEGRRDAIKWATTDSTIALMLALFVNAAILSSRPQRSIPAAMPMWPKSARRSSCCRRCSASASPRRCSRSRCSPRASTRR